MNLPEKRRGVLDLIDDQRKGVVAEKAVGILFRLRGDSGKIQGDILHLRENMPDQRRLPRLSVPRYNHGGKLRKQAPQRLFILSCNPHADILQYNCKIVKPN